MGDGTQGGAVQPLLSVIVPVADDEALTCLESLETHPPAVPVELVVVAGPGGAAAARRLEGAVTVVDGYPAALGAARGATLLLLDPAVRFGPGWFGPLMAALDGDPSVGAV